MNWKYYLPENDFELEDEQIYCNVFLINDEKYPLFFTLDTALSLIRSEGWKHRFILNELKELDKEGMLFDKGNMWMTINGESFDKKELVKRIKEFIILMDFKVDELEEGMEEEFKGIDFHTLCFPFSEED